MRTAHLLVAVSFVGLAVAWACGSGSEPDAPSVEELYRRVATEVTRPGYVYHEVKETEIHDEQGDRKGTSEVWVDTSRDRARARTSKELTGRDEITVVIAEGRAFSTEYSDSQDHGGQGFDVMAACHGVNAAVTFVMEGITATGCIEDGAHRLENGQHDGKAVMVLTRGPRGDDAKWTERLYFDGSTFLPVADEVEAIADSGRRITAVAGFRHDFVEARSLPADFFEPAAAGYHGRTAADSLARIDPGVTVYGLGDNAIPTGRLPQLSLLGVELPSSFGGPGYGAILKYGRAGDTQARPVLTLQQWSAAAWEQFLAGSRGNNLWDRMAAREVLLPHGRATVFSGEGRFLAHVYFEGTVVLVDAPGACDSKGCTSSPFNDAEAMDVVVRALVLLPR